MTLPAQSQSRVSCSEAKCLKTFGRPSEMLRHLTEFHQPKKNCPYPGCPYAGAKRAGRVRQHMLKRHPQLFNGMKSTTISQLQTFHAGHSSAVPLQVYPVSQFDLQTNNPSFTQIIGTVQSNKQIVNMSFSYGDALELDHPQNNTSQIIFHSNPRPSVERHRIHQSLQSPRRMMGKDSDFDGWIEHELRHTYGEFNGTNHAQAWDIESNQI